jgi:hypothetical protein
MFEWRRHDVPDLTKVLRTNLPNENRARMKLINRNMDMIVMRLSDIWAAVARRLARSTSSPSLGSPFDAPNPLIPNYVFDLQRNCILDGPRRQLVSIQPVFSGGLYSSTSRKAVCGVSGMI